MNHDDHQPVFYVPGRAGIIDVAVMRNGVQVGEYSNETIEQLAARYPGAALGELGKVAEDSENSFRSPPAEITQARYVEMLEVLPPVNWTGIGSAEESFKLSERTYGNITAIFCRLGDRHFELADSVFMGHAQIVAACKAASAVEFHDDKPDERADMHVTTQPGDIDLAGRTLRSGT